jgi:UDP-N-acetylglucosamine--N-acetylmuramyl-(pentapeptide) pyrophosphoryl-undecaprenol N-acetylglucosamine transferase
MTNPSQTLDVLIAAGGTGGHVFPAVAVAGRLKAMGLGVHWIGTNRGLERKVAKSSDLTLTELAFEGVRGKGLTGWLRLPTRLAMAAWEVFQILRRIRPRLVMVFGGYVSFPVGLVARLMGLPLIVLEQNAVMGSANRWLARLADAVVTSFPNTRYAPRTSQCLGNPVREALVRAEPHDRVIASRSGAIRILVLGGSLGAAPLNQFCPRIFAQCQDQGVRFEVLHQTGLAGLEQTRRLYQDLAVQSEVVAFIDDMASAYEWADLLICRAGASTVAELMALAIPAIFVPLPHAIDDHQTANAAAMTEQGTAWLVAQGPDFQARVTEILMSLRREDLVDRARKLVDADARHALSSVIDLVQQKFLRPTAPNSPGAGA